MQNEFKFSLLRNFGSEQVSFTSTIQSKKAVLSQEEIDSQVSQLGIMVEQAFIKCQDREISEKELLAKASERRTEAVKKYDEALKEEMKTKADAGQTLKNAERLDRKLSK